MFRTYCHKAWVEKLLHVNAAQLRNCCQCTQQCFIRATKLFATGLGDKATASAAEGLTNVSRIPQRSHQSPKLEMASLGEVCTDMTVPQSCCQRPRTSD